MKPKTFLGRLSWYWKYFWGTRYCVIEDEKVVKEVLVYHHKIYILKIENKKKKGND